jgi:hypothetical protein
MPTQLTAPTVLVLVLVLCVQMMATAPEESLNPTRDVPLAIGISVAGCTILYLLMALVITGEAVMCMCKACTMAFIHGHSGRAMHDVHQQRSLHQQ